MVLRKIPLTSNSTYVAIYSRQYPSMRLPHSAKRHIIKVKERLLKMGIISQCIELDKMLLAINKDEDTIRQGEGQPFRQN